jgi:hypothetical protein
MRIGLGNDYWRPSEGHPPEVPVTGERKNVKILGAIELWRTRFHYREDTVFNASSYLAFLEQLTRSYRRHGAILVQDNASYHKDSEVWSWFRSNRHWLEVHQLPPYSPELQHTRRTGTHNRYFDWRPKGSQLWRYAVGVLTVPAASGAGVAKLGCSDRAQAVAVAFHRGIISLE